MNIFNQSSQGSNFILKSVMVLLTVLLFASACGGNIEEVDERGLPEATDAPAQELMVDLPDLQAITLLTPTKGVSVKPYFEWEAVEGASYYVLVVYDPDGKSYWSWQGEGNGIYLGGGYTQPPLDSAGPILLAGMSWGVMAFDEEDTLIAASSRQSISP